jgi:phage-related protein
MINEAEKAEQGEESVKPLFWIANSLADLREFPEEVKDTIGFALYQAQRGGKHIAAKPFKGFGGAGVLEIVDDDKGNTFRGVYNREIRRHCLRSGCLPEKIKARSENAETRHRAH